jgi:hypothetical protein
MKPAYRTTSVNEILTLIYRSGKGFTKTKPGKNTRQSHQAPLKINLSNQFHEDLRKLYDLQPFVKLAPFRPKSK